MRPPTRQADDFGHDDVPASRTRGQDPGRADRRRGSDRRAVRPRRLTYADYTASGRSLDFIEDLIRSRVLPMYGNTHTEASVTGRRTPGPGNKPGPPSIARWAPADDLVLFCGSGSTAAVDKLVRLLGLFSGSAEPRRPSGGVRGSLRAPL